MRQTLAQSNALQHGRGLAARIAHAPQLQWQHDVFNGAQVRQQLKALEYKAQVGRAVGGPIVLAQGEQILSTQMHAAMGRHVQASQQGQQSAFARPGGPHDGHSLTRLQGEVDLVQNVQGAR